MSNFSDFLTTRCRKLSTTSRTTEVVPEGEIVYDTDLSSAWVGDGATSGGKVVGSGSAMGNIISEPFTIESGTSSIVVGALEIQSNLTINGNLGVI